MGQTKEQRAKKATEKRINAACSKALNYVEIRMLDLPKVSEAGERFLAEHPAATDAELETAVRAFVETIRIKDE